MRGRSVVYAWRRAVVAAACALLWFPLFGQVNAEQVTAIGRNVLSMEDYALAIQYFNLAIRAKPYLSDPYYLRALAKLSLEDYKGADADCSEAIKRNKFKTDAYKLRGFVRQQMGQDSLAIIDYDEGLRYAPYDKYFLYYKACAQTEMKAYDAADTTFAILLRAFPGFEEAYSARARASLMRGDTVAALKDIDKSLEISKNLVNSYLLRADIKARRKEWDAALADTEEAVRLMPREAGLYINRAYIRYNSDDFFGAMADYNHALELEPDNMAAMFNRALLRYEVKDLDRAAEDFSSVLEREPQNFHALYNRGLVRLEQGKPKDALADFEATARRYPRFYPAYYAIAQARQDDGDMRGAVAAVKKAESLVKGYVSDPQKNSLDRPAIDAGRSNRRGGEESDESEEEVMNRFNRLVTVSAGSDTQLSYGDKVRGKVQDRDLRVEPEPMYEVGFAYNPSALQSTSNYFREIDEFNSRHYLEKPLYLSKTGSAVNAEELFGMVNTYSHLIESGRARPADWLGRGVAYLALRDYEAAVADLDRAIAEGGNAFTIAFMARGAAHAGLAKMPAANSDEKQPALRNSAAETAAAMADFDRALQLNPRLIYSWFNKGNLYLEAKDATSAIQCYNEALAINPSYGEAYYNRALAYLQSGMRKQAFDDLSKAGELGVIASYSLLKRMQ